jgi:hypothetical protein
MYAYVVVVVMSELLASAIEHRISGTNSGKPQS